MPTLQKQSQKKMNMVTRTPSLAKVMMTLRKRVLLKNQQLQRIPRLLRNLKPLLKMTRRLVIPARKKTMAPRKRYAKTRDVHRHFSFSLSKQQKMTATRLTPSPAAGPTSAIPAAAIYPASISTAPVWPDCVFPSRRGEKRSACCISRIGQERRMQPAPRVSILTSWQKT